MKPPSLSLSLRGSMSPLMIAKKSGQFSTLQVAAAKRGIKTIESKQIHTTREGLGGILSTEEKVHRLLKGANFREAARWAIPLKTSHESVSSELTLTFHRTEYRVKYTCKMLWNCQSTKWPNGFNPEMQQMHHTKEFNPVGPPSRVSLEWKSRQSSLSV